MGWFGDKMEKFRHVPMGISPASKLSKKAQRRIFGYESNQPEIEALAKSAGMV